jgi:hypothetical protein
MKIKPNSDSMEKDKKQVGLYSTLSQLCTVKHWNNNFFNNNKI